MPQSNQMSFLRSLAANTSDRFTQAMQHQTGPSMRARASRCVDMSFIFEEQCGTRAACDEWMDVIDRLVVNDYEQVPTRVQP